MHPRALSRDFLRQSMSNIEPEPGKKPWRLRSVDQILIAALLIVGVIFAAKVVFTPSPSSSEAGDTVRVYRENHLIAEYPLDQDRIFAVEGRLGVVKVEIKNKRARIVSANCRNQICVRMGWIDRPKDQFIYCAPNRILVLIESSRKEQ